MPRRVLHLLLAVTVLLGVPLAAPAGLGPAALAARHPATLTLDDLEPVVLSTGDTLRVAGRVANTGRGELRDVEVRLRLSATRLGSRAELSSVVAGQTTSRDGEAIVTRSLPDLGRGEAVDFTLERATDELTPLTGFGVYVLGVEVLASRAAGFGRVALERILLPWVPDDEDIVPTGWTWLWPLVARPSRLADGTFADDALAAQLEPDGRLGRMLAQGQRLADALSTEPDRPAGLVWAIDPELVDAVVDMADGYDVAGPDGLPVPGPSSAVAVQWLGQLRVATGGEAVLPLPTGDIDVAAVVRAGLSRDLEAALASGAEVLTGQLPAATVVTHTAWPVGGWATRATLAALRRLDVTSVVLDGRALPSEVDLAYTPSGRAGVASPAGRLDALLGEPGLADLLAQVPPASSPGAPATRAATAATTSRSLLAAQRFVAETAMIASELPSGPARRVLVMPPREFDPDPAVVDRLVAAAEQARWLTPVPLADLAATPPPEVDRDPLVYPRQQRAAELPPSYFVAMRAMHDSTAALAAILTDTSEYIPGLSRTMLLLESGWWRDRPQARANRLARERGYLADLRGAVRVQPGNFTFSSRSGTLALTVANELDQPVQVILRLRPLTPRLRLDPVEPQTIGARSKQQIEIDAQAIAPGPVTVEAALRTPAGAPYDEPVKLQITITEFGTVALYITVGAALVLFLAAGIRVVRRLRHQDRQVDRFAASARPEDPPWPGSAPEPAGSEGPPRDEEPVR